MGQQTRFDLYDAEIRFLHFKRIFDLSLEATMNDDFYSSLSVDLAENYSADDMKDIDELLTELKSEEDMQVTQAFLGSILLSNYSLFEFSALEMCRDFLHEKGFTLSLRDLSGQGIEKIKVVGKLTKQGLPVSGLEWQRVLDYRDIRNIIAHNHGFLDRGSISKIEKVIDRNRALLALEEDARSSTTLILSRDFVAESFKCFILYLRKLNRCFELELS